MPSNNGGTMMQTNEIRRKLLTQRRELFRAVAKVEDELLWLETDVESEMEEHAQDETFIRLLSRLDDRQKVAIEDIDRALYRNANGNYGRCEVCDKPIPLDRLDALPATTSCMSCALAREHRSA